MSVLNSSKPINAPLVAVGLTLGAPVAAATSTFDLVPSSLYSATGAGSRCDWVYVLWVTCIGSLKPEKIKHGLNSRRAFTAKP
jgi:hypothetical protein